MMGLVQKCRSPLFSPDARWLLLAPVILTVVLGKISMPPFSARGLGVALPLMLMATSIACLSGAFVIHSSRTVIYLALIILVGFLQLFGEQSFSAPSLVFLCAIYWPFTLRLASVRADGEAGRIAFRNFATTLAGLGVLQYLAQFVVGEALAFPLEHFLPSGFLIQNYNYLIPLHYGSSIFKSNGVFFLEPSFFSQFVAVAFLIELSVWNSKPRCLLYVAALMCTFSGTGLVVLMSGAITLVIAQRRWGLIAVCLLIGALAFALGDVIHLDVYMQRSGEFDMPGSSGFERFVAWTYLLSDKFWSDSFAVLGGTGTGSFAGMAAESRYPVAEMSFAKAILEFGIPGALLYLGFLVYSIGSGSAPLAVKVGLATCILMNGAYSESITGMLLTLAIWPSSRTADVGSSAHISRPLAAVR